MWWQNLKTLKEIKFEITKLPEAVKEFLDSVGNDRIFLFEGEMGAGKTTFIAEVCRQLGADDDFGSPTFSLVNEYEDAQGNPIYHFDLYRIDSPKEAMEMGVEEYFESGEICLVEWPDRLGHLTPEEGRLVELKVNPDNSRTLVF